MRACTAPSPLPRLRPKSGLPDFGTNDGPKSDISDFGWRPGGGSHQHGASGAPSPPSPVSGGGRRKLESGATRMLRIKGLEKRYQTGDLALRGIDFDLPDGQVMALIGPSGAGKST